MECCIPNSEFPYTGMNSTTILSYLGAREMTLRLAVPNTQGGSQQSVLQGTRALRVSSSTEDVACGAHTHKQANTHTHQINFNCN